MKTTYWKPLCLMLTTCLFACTAVADPPPGKRPPARSGDATVRVTAGITIGDARALAMRYGLTGAKPLPPGIRKNLARGKPLPPGIAKTRMPEPFIAALPQHAGYEWRRAGADLVLVVQGSLVITDILHGVFD